MKPLSKELWVGRLINPAILRRIKSLEKRLARATKWTPKSKAPKNSESYRVLAKYVGVYRPCSGHLQDGKFYPHNRVGSEPFTHYRMLR